MALPTTIGVFRYPYVNSPERTFIQGVKAGATDGAMVIIATLTSGTPFRLTKLMLSIYNPTAGASLSVELKGESILTVSGATMSSWSLDFGPTGILSDTTNSSTVKTVVTGATVGAQAFALGYFD